MRIGEVASLTGIPASAIRYYETEGIIERPARDLNGYRRYTAAAIEKLLLVRDAQRLGFSLEIIRGLFLRDGRCSMSVTVMHISQRLEELERIEASLQTQRSELLNLRKTLEDSLRAGTEPVFDRNYWLAP